MCVPQSCAYGGGDKDECTEWSATEQHGWSKLRECNPCWRVRAGAEAWALYAIWCGCVEYSDDPKTGARTYGLKPEWLDLQMRAAELDGLDAPHADLEDYTWTELVSVMREMTRHANVPAAERLVQIGELEGR